MNSNDYLIVREPRGAHQTDCKGPTLTPISAEGLIADLLAMLGHSGAIPRFHVYRENKYIGTVERTK